MVCRFPAEPFLQANQVKVILDVGAIEARLDYVFKDKELLASALTHASAAETMQGRKAKISRSDTNQRLEFLGDRVLGLVISEELFRRFPHLDEGGMTQRFHNIVSLAACARSARRMDLGKFVVMSPAQATAGGASASGILGDAAEAVTLAEVRGDGVLARPGLAADAEEQRDTVHRGSVSPGGRGAGCFRAAPGVLVLPRASLHETTPMAPRRAPRAGLAARVPRRGGG